MGPRGAPTPALRASFGGEALRHARARRSALGAALAAAALGAACAPPGSGSAAPSVLLVTVDTLRADHLGAFGDPRGASPGIDRLLRGAAGFEQAFVPRGQTWPSLATLMTSLPPAAHGVRKNGQAMNEGCTALADVLRARGYRTAAFLSNAGKATWSGFEEVTDLRDLDLPVVARAKGWLRGAAPGPFLLWVHLFSPHAPYAAPAPLTTRFDPGYRGAEDGSLARIRAIERGGSPLPPEDARHLVARYDAEVSWVDARVDDLVRTLDELGIAERTLVVFAADHGEELGARQAYFSHSASIYDTVLRVPLAFRLPGRLPPRTIPHAPAEIMDAAPTVLSLLGIEPPVAWEGRDLAPVLAGAPPDTAHAAFAELEDRVVSIRTARWRYLRNPDGFDFPLEGGGAFRLERGALFDHEVDPAERRDVSSARPDVVRALRERTEAWMTAHAWEEASRRHAGRTVPDAVRRELEALGYVH